MSTRDDLDLDFNQPECVLRAFARWCGVQVLDQWEIIPPSVVVEYLCTGREALRAKAYAVATNAAAYSAANSAANLAAGAVAYSAADVVANFAAYSAAYFAADAATDYGVDAIANFAAWTAFRAAQQAQLLEMSEQWRGGQTEWTWTLVGEERVVAGVVLPNGATVIAVNGNRLLALWNDATPWAVWTFTSGDPGSTRHGQYFSEFMVAVAIFRGVTL